MLIDAEGSECFVIAGAKETIRRSPHMSLIVEWSPHVLGDEAKRSSAETMWEVFARRDAIPSLPHLSGKLSGVGRHAAFGVRHLPATEKRAALRHSFDATSSQIRSLRS